MKIVETCNFDSDYPDEKFVNLGSLNIDQAEHICEAINQALGGGCAPRYWKIVNDDYELIPGFEP